jgi:hypothetical protein
MIIAAQLLIFLAFTCGIAWKFGVQESISDSWYCLSQKWNWLFTVVFCFGIGVTNAFHGNLLYLISGAFLCFVGVATEFKSEWLLTGTIHVIGAVGSIAFSVVALIIDGVYWPIIPIFLTWITLKNIRNSTWWSECIAFLVIQIGLIQRL